MADSPLADYQTVLGYQGLVGQNPYLTYQGAIPMAGYYGAPTDASGRPIQSYQDAQVAHDQWAATHPAQPQGTTLNSHPQVDAVTNQLLGWNALGHMNQPNYRPSTGDPYLDSINGIGQSGGPQFDPSRAGGQAQQQQAAAPAQTNPVDMRQAYLSALANPGKVTTPGAQIYPGAAQTGAPQPSVLDKFLASNQASTGGGGYSNAPFFQTLNALKQGQST